MRKLLLFLALIASAEAANPSAVLSSAQPLLGALSSLPNLSANFQPNYIPGYGFQANGFVGAPVGSFASDPIPAETAVVPITNVLLGLSSTVESLDAGDWVSVSFELSTLPEIIYGTVRVKPGQPETLETWIDGKLQ